MATDNTPATEVLQEYASSAGLTLKVDRDRGVVPGVKILGLVSSNGRTYTPKCAADAMPLYENAAVFVDHQKKGESRSYHDRIGHLSNVTAKPDGLYADFIVNPKHSLAEQLFWDAEHAPAHVGFSHDCFGSTVKKDGKVIVESIAKVHSVDLVAKPATTLGLFESEELPADPAHRELCEHGLSAVSDARVILLGNEPIETKKARLVEVLAVWSAELTGKQDRIKEQATMEWTDITRESLTEHRKDLVEQLTGTDDISKLTVKVAELTEAIASKEAALTEANAKLALVEADKAKQEKKLLIAEELKAAKLDASDKVAVSDAFLEALDLAADADGRKRLIEDRVAVSKARSVGTISAAPFGTVGGTGSPANTKEELLKRL